MKARGWDIPSVNKPEESSVSMWLTQALELRTHVPDRCKQFSWALLSSSLAWGLTMAAGSYLEKSPYLVYFISVFGATWFAGWRAGLYATFITVTFAVVFTGSSSELWLITAPVIPTITYLGLCLLTVFLLARAQLAVVERRDAEGQLQQLNRELEKRVAQRTAAWEEANQDLEAFAYSVSHDLRTPLRAIDGFTRILREDYASKLDEQGLQYFENVCINSARMSQMINDLLSFSRLSRKSMARARVDMRELAESVSHELLALEPTRPVRLNILELPAAFGDMALLRQVLINLLSNSLKFTRRKPMASITIGGSIEEEFATYYVQDDGVGFDQSYAHKLFKVFQRLHKPEEFEGTGVGLSIVHRIIQRHGGKVWAEGQKNAGAKFTFTVPLQPNADTEMMEMFRPRNPCLSKEQPMVLTQLGKGLQSADCPAAK